MAFVPNTWRNVRLGDVAKYSDEKISTSQLRRDDYISTENMLPNRGGVQKAASLPTTNYSTLYKRGQTLVSNIRPYFKKIWLADKNGGCSNDVLCFCPISAIDDRFLYYLLSQDLFFDYAMKGASGTKMPRGNKKHILEFSFELPPRFEQEKIVAVLKGLDEKIAKNKAINDNLHRQCCLLCKDFYYDGTEGNLGNYLDTIESGNRPKGGAVSKGIPSIGAENIERFGIYDYSKDKFVNPDFFFKLKRGIVKSGDVLLYKDGAYTGKVSLAFNGFPHKVCAVNEHVFILRTNEKMESQFFLYFILSLPENRKWLLTMASSKAAQPGLNQTELAALPILVPKLDKIKRFDDIVHPFVERISLNAIENRRLTELRDALLPRLMSGELDVSKVEI